MKNFNLENVDCHATLAMTKNAQSGRSMIEKRWGFPRRTLRALLAMTENTQSGRSLLAESGTDAQSGRSMIEMLGVLAIIGVLSVGGIAGYSKAMNKYRINKTIEQITLIAGNVRAFFAPQKSYVGLHCGYVNNSITNGADTGCIIAKKAKLIPDEMITSYSETEGSSGLRSSIVLTNAFGGGFALDAADKSSAEANKAFSMTYIIDSDEACIELVSQDWTNASVAAIGVVDANTRSEVYLKTPVSVENAVKYCENHYVGLIRFIFDIDVNAAPWKTSLK